MASRALWKGQLRLSLVSIPVELHSAKKTGSHVSFRQIHKPSGKPIHYQKVVNGIGPVESDDIAKGYDVGDDQYVLFSDDEIESVKLDTKKTLELVQFVESCEIPPIYFDKPYYLVPTDELAEDAYRVVRDALRQTSRVGLGQLALRGREYLCAIKPCGDGLLLETLHYADEIKNVEPLFSSITEKASDQELLEVANALIEKKSAPFDAKVYKDHYSNALKQLIEERTQKSKARKVSKIDDTDTSRGGNVVDLMAALKQSLAKAGSPSNTKSAPRKSRSNKDNSTRSSASKTHTTKNAKQAKKATSRSKPTSSSRKSTTRKKRAS